MRRMSWVYLIGLVTAALPLEAWAQSLVAVPARRNVFGLGGAYMQPTGEFHDFVSGGGGLNLNFVAGIGQDFRSIRRDAVCYEDFHGDLRGLVITPVKYSKKAEPSIRAVARPGGVAYIARATESDESCSLHETALLARTRSHRVRPYWSSGSTTLYMIPEEGSLEKEEKGMA